MFLVHESIGSSLTKFHLKFSSHGKLFDSIYRDYMPVLE